MRARESVAARIRTATAAWAGGASLGEIRAGFAELLAGPEPAPCTAGRVGPCEALLCGGTPTQGQGMVLFLHGGGFQIGGPASHRSLMSRIAAASGVPVAGIDYRLAPEHRFPAAADDCLAAYRALLEAGHAAQQIVLAGDSAGGHLVLGTVLAAQAQGLEAPAALVLISPWLDLETRGASYESRAALDIFSKAPQLRAMARTYIGRDGDPRDPRLAPLDAPLAGLPPMLIHAGDHDITLDDALTLAARARDQGVECHLRVWPQMYHHFQVFAELPEAQQSLDEIAAFITARLAR